MRRSQTLVAALPVIACLLALPPGVSRAAEDEQAAVRNEEARFLTRVRQLTFEGRRAGEGYFSPDGSRMVFQSEREPGNPFFQIYVLDFTTGETRRLSPGIGRTTCAFFRPGSDDILYASTHHDPRSRELQQAEYEFRAAGRRRHYNWEFDPEMEIYVARGSEGATERLTSARGYDAEGSYSPDGRWIVFTSTRPAYGRELSDEDSRRLESDPSYFGEIYLMRADGTDVKRLTEAPGYDGGPFFSSDGEWIIWRRFEADGLIADVWRMRLDGSEQKRLTEFGAMSWAPYPHPSGDYILFTSNKLGFDNFELFVVDFEGLKEPVRVTNTAGFDGLPAPSPDGRRLAWTSTRHGGKQGQIMLAGWNHESAQEALRAAPPRSSVPQEGE
jgi:Tol biopolymer transport system component